MNEIPPDIFAKAFAVTSEIQMEHVSEWQGWDGTATIGLIAKALMQERDDCAKLAIRAIPEKTNG